MDLWPHQQRGIGDTLAALAAGHRRVCITSPTGGGKTRIMLEVARDFLERGKKVVLYTNRKMLVDQTSDVLMAAGMYHGVRAAGYADERDHPFQVSSIQTEASRVLKRGAWQLHDADLALVDEAHSQTSETARTILAAHVQKGGSYVGFTATPLGIGGLYDCLLVAGTPTELRGRGALVPAHHYGPDEPDLRKLKGLREGIDLSERLQQQAMPAHVVWGRVIKWFRLLNPEMKPSILFAPGVDESLFFAEAFTEEGIPAAHIDGECVWVNGKWHRSSRQARADVLEASRDGRVAVLCNRFVLREGVDAPWLVHGIFATVFGGLQSYLQAGGRLLRAYPGLDHVAVQDHGGNWWRHGSLNADRDWSLDLTGEMAYAVRADRLRSRLCRRCRAKLGDGSRCGRCGFLNEREPVRCPECSRIVNGWHCPCGHELTPGKRSRVVAQADGHLVEHVGAAFKPRRISTAKNGPALWERMYYRSRTEKGARTFRAAAALFAQENRWAWPDPAWPLMPKYEMDWYSLVADVPYDRLIPKENADG